MQNMLNHLLFVRGNVILHLIYKFVEQQYNTQYTTSSPEKINETNEIIKTESINMLLLGCTGYQQKNHIDLKNKMLKFRN